MKAHGTRTIHRKGKVEYIDLCPCHRIDLTQSGPLDSEAKIDILSRRVVDAEKRADTARSVAEASVRGLEGQQMRLGYEATNVRNELNTAQEAADKRHAEVMRELFLLSNRVTELESLSLLTLIKRCFGR